ncbi:hypothetical protein [Bacillus sp. A260]|uniref:hypothetical protein n=1 Tax=Bacillus sp. A260 TaxID=2660750 RepID=UPI001315DD1B|nr:hypothetical protein [Bacillus sp. A260]QGY38565.1 hypothetical protein GD442_27445 [Bacillus sp. A260]
MEKNDDVVSEVHLKTIDVSRITNLAESTIRKYLEKQGYQFNKDGDKRNINKKGVPKGQVLTFRTSTTFYRLVKGYESKK